MRENEQERHYEGWNPDAQSGATDERSLDIEAGQFAPDDYDNQRTVNQPDRRTRDDDVAPPGRR